ncbi:PAS domain-containing protein [Halobellus ruber]|uniref:PAS domain-containing protein n=1 Tax=Halobellus ruber TaxID=2761102 RepID=A0A7J9SEK9_9EURY|nr:PAS domain-containing protein [Halobellus ruber]MBB6645385.1 PAS domain-containing protein [Halobellus ruber]
MSPNPGITGAGARSDDDTLPIGESTILLFLESGRDRELLIEALGETYDVETATDVEALDMSFDCCIFGKHEFNRVAGTVQSKRDRSSPVFLPFVLLADGSAAGELTHAWEYVDDIIELPVDKAALHARIENLVQRRQTAMRLAEREEQLQETVEDLRLKEQAMDKAPVGITIGERRGDEIPLIYANERFEELTGYSLNVLGEDCRFLQGEETDPETVAEIRQALQTEEPVSVDILNYRQNGQKFWNKLDIAPIHDEDELVTNYVGFQTEITDRKLRELRLQVLNRVLSHNLRNKMNVIEGYLSLLRDELDDAEPPQEITEIERTAADLIGLAEAVRKSQQTLDSQAEPIELFERMVQLMNAFEERYPQTDFELTLPANDPCEVTVSGLLTAIEEAVENAVKHNDNPEPSVAVTVDRRSSDWVEIEITDNGPGIPSNELEVLDRGETALKHADRLGIWLIYWVVNKAGGEFSVSRGDSDTTTVQLSVPTGGSPDPSAGKER